MPVKVIDASALAAVLFGEPAEAEISERVKGDPLTAPTLLRYEIGSVCLKKVRRHPERRESLLQALALFSRLDLWEVEIPALESTELAEREGLTVYDAAYLWLSRSLRAELVTLDADLAAAARR
jgi:predicted nucleic acid-binding protein